ncbi:MAG TPA: gluconate 2-dehydrogenase subunit 3 family protein [Blastocatellia bacterium]|nr:gluconate 2-dehydrogenase subunit 3 family protein [Blastocatellia bacterium]
MTPEKGVLNPDQIAQLDAIFARILPGDPARNIPNAVKAGASLFVSQLLAMGPSVYVEISNWQELYPAALRALEQYCQANHQQSLTQADDEKVNAIIAGLEQGSLAGFPSDIDQKTLFKTLLRHCLQGCFADPRWGGNRDKVMWRALGYLQLPEDNLA